MRESSKTAIAVLVVIAVAGSFWLLLIGPKRDKANELSEQVNSLRSSVASEQVHLAEAVKAKGEFPSYYRQLVVLGKAVPVEADTPSLLVQLNGLGRRAETSFLSIVLGEATSETVEVPGETASLLPIGAAVGPAGLPAMSYTLEFTGGFFQIANFIHGVDSMVKTENDEVVPRGRLVMIDGFTMAPKEESEAEKKNGPHGALTAKFEVTTYVTPPGSGVTAGATESGPAGEGETP
jgi:Tfp pilus assembly protein PilO